MKILYVLTGLGMGGAEAITVEVANKMFLRGHQVAILYLVGDNLQKHRLDQRIPVWGLNMCKSPLSLLVAVYRARKLVINFSPDIVHGQMVHANLFCRFLRLFCTIPHLICTEHNKNIEGRIRMWFYRFTDKLSDLNTNVSKEATSYFISQKAFSPYKSMTLYNGVDLSKFSKDVSLRTFIRKKYNILDSEFFYLNVGRLTKAKDHKTLIEAFSILVLKGLPVKLVIVGDGDERENLYQLIKDKSLTDVCLLAGIHKDVCQFYSAADCFVLSSLWEGFPMVLIEAMSMELPIVATECGREAINDESYIVPSQNASLLANKMLDIYNLSHEERINLGRVNRLKALKFDIDAICNQWEELYRSLLSNKSLADFVTHSESLT